VLWPWDEYGPFWGFASDYILNSIFWAGYGIGPGYAASDVYDIYGNGARRSVSPQRDRIESANGPTAHAALNEACIGLAPGVTSLPISRIQREIQPIGDQLAAFEELKTALSKADEMIKASCSNEVPLTPAKRLEVVQARLNTMADVVRTSITKGRTSHSNGGETWAQNGSKCRPCSEPTCGKFPAQSIKPLPLRCGQSIGEPAERGLHRIIDMTAKQRAKETQAEKEIEKTK
jgi:hypothetical protein